jgi:hypothetical protein
MGEILKKKSTIFFIIVTVIYLMLEIKFRYQQ